LLPKLEDDVTVPDLGPGAGGHSFLLKLALVLADDGGGKGGGCSLVLVVGFAISVLYFCISLSGLKGSVCGCLEDDDGLKTGVLGLNRDGPLTPPGPPADVTGLGGSAGTCGDSGDEVAEDEADEVWDIV